MQHKFILHVTDNLKNEFNFERNPKKSDRSNLLTDYALKALECFKTFKPSEELVPVLAIIGCKLLKPIEKEAIQKLFRIMDESGDGNLGP